MSRTTAEAAVARMSEREKDYVALMVLRVVRDLHLFYVKKPVRLSRPHLAASVPKEWGSPSSCPQGRPDKVA